MVHPGMGAVVMPMNYWVVLTVNQASHQVETDAYVYWHQADAIESAELMAKRTAERGRRERYYVAEVEPDDEWTEVRSPEGGNE